MGAVRVLNDGANWEVMFVLCIVLEWNVYGFVSVNGVLHCCVTKM